MQLTKRHLIKFGALALLLLPVNLTSVYAHGPERKKVTETVVIDNSPEEVWERLKNFSDLTWHPAVEKSEGEGGNAVDATRVLTLTGGGQIFEQLYRYVDEKMTYSYRITEVDVAVLPVTNYSSHLTVKPADGGRALVEWRGAFYRGYPNNDPPEHLNNDAAIAAVTGVYKAGLSHLKSSMEGTN